MRKYPKGHATKYGHLKIAINFPADLFASIIDMAIAESKTFNQMVVELCKVGKLDLEESDRHEPKTSVAERKANDSRIIRG